MSGERGIDTAENCEFEGVKHEKRKERDDYSFLQQSSDW